MRENPFNNGIKIMIGDQVLHAKTGSLTISEEYEGARDSECGWDGRHDFNRSWEIECNRVVSEIDDDLKKLFDKSPREIAFSIRQQPGKMPRKMKKAHKTDPLHKTKWGRKAHTYIERLVYRAQHAEIIMIDEIQGVFTAEVKFDRLQRGCDSVKISGHDSHSISFSSAISAGHNNKD